MEPTLQAVFGAGASQTATHLTIAKADLPGLTASANNTAESMLVGLLIRLKGVLTEDAQENNASQSTRVALGDESLVVDFETNTKYLEYPFTISARQPYLGQALDPNAH